ncbi:MAG: RHS repeat-associated core domain-containing protein [Chlamydiota bacterium]
MKGIFIPSLGEIANNTFRYAHTYLKMDPNSHVEKEKLIYNLGVLHTSHDLLERPSIQTSKWNTHQVFYDPLGRVYQINSSLFPEKKISYDPLNQITQEGDKTYLFDSIGNSSDYETNDCNEVLSTLESTLIYDLDGNLIERILKDQTILYTYDALGRLTSITYPKQKKILYFYDAFSRLFSKETHLPFGNDFQKTEEVFFLYDQDKEIGTLNEKGEILQLKVLGLGLGADIGAAVALELNDIVYAPLHDFSGNCIALLSSTGEIVARYQIDAFGKEIATPSSPENPWRFSSKRQEEGLVFFGLRFYDLALERWLTPDPSGFADGPNLYAYVGNSPLNRLDLFGLNGVDAKQSPVIEVYISNIPLGVGHGVLVPAISIVDGVRINWYAACGHWHQLQYSADEIKAGKINLLNHFSELMPQEGGQVGLLSLQNGINTLGSGFKEMAQSIVDKIPEGTLFLGMYNPTCCTQHDLKEIEIARAGIETPMIRAKSQMMGAIAETIHKINPNLIWFDTLHSGGGATGRRAIERLTQDQKQILKNQYYSLSIGSAQLIPDSYGLAVYNIYSDNDFVTKRYATEQNDGFTYNVEFLKCQSSIWEQTGFIADHAFLGTTYQLGIDDKVMNTRKNRGFYSGNTR